MDETHKHYWEDFHPGDTAPMGEKRMDAEEMLAFASAYDPQPFHVDDAAARRSMYGGLIASGWHTVALVMRMMVDSYLNASASLGSPGVENVRWMKPGTARVLTFDAKADATITYEGRPTTIHMR